jgi:hypothetical protein
MKWSDVWMKYGFMMIAAVALVLVVLASIAIAKAAGLF